MAVRTNSSNVFWGAPMPAIEGASVRYYYELSGNADGDVLVFVNSLGSNLRMWEKVLPVFERSYRVLRYDMRGHGQSSAPLGPYSIEELGEDLLFLLNRLGFDRVNLCGLSLGGLVVMWVAINAPQRVRRIILANTAARIGTSEAWNQRIAAAQSMCMASLAEATIDRWFTSSYRDCHVAEMELIRTMIASTDANAYTACCGVLRDTDLRSKLGSIKVPSLVIAGKYDPATPPSDGRALYSALQASSYVELDGSHLSAWEQHEAFAEAAHSFLGLR